MSTIFSWKTPATIATALTTELNALATTNYSAASSAIDNETSPNIYMNVELVLSSLAVPAGGYAQLFLIQSLDTGSNYEDAGSSTVAPPQAPIAIFPLFASTSAKRTVVTNIVVPPLNFKLIVGNQVGVSFGATLSTLKYRLHNELGT